MEISQQYTNPDQALGELEELFASLCADIPITPTATPPGSMRSKRKSRSPRSQREEMEMEILPLFYGKDSKVQYSVCADVNKNESPKRKKRQSRTNSETTRSPRKSDDKSRSKSDTHASTRRITRARSRPSIKPVSCTPPPSIMTPPPPFTSVTPPPPFSSRNGSKASLTISPPPAYYSRAGTPTSPTSPTRETHEVREIREIRALPKGPRVMPEGPRPLPQLPEEAHSVPQSPKEPRTLPPLIEEPLLPLIEEPPKPLDAPGRYEFQPYYRPLNPVCELDFVGDDEDLDEGGDWDIYSVVSGHPSRRKRDEVSVDDSDVHSDLYTSITALPPVWEDTEISYDIPPSVHKSRSRKRRSDPAKRSIREEYMAQAQAQAPEPTPRLKRLVVPEAAHNKIQSPLSMLVGLIGGMVNSAGSAVGSSVSKKKEKKSKRSSSSSKRRDGSPPSTGKRKKGKRSEV
ncbi:hypothetical protein EDC01DRAFT_648234 [Geopyxis carbonaria]|nr:hypothetical protein EDC01DRAFT_648234 [Geopyxis carbonaria]